MNFYELIYERVRKDQAWVKDKGFDFGHLQMTSKRCQQAAEYFTSALQWA